MKQEHKQFGLQWRLLLLFVEAISPTPLNSLSTLLNKLDDSPQRTATHVPVLLGGSGA